MSDKFHWRPIATAPTEPFVGTRGEMILACDAEGRVGRTFWVNDHPRGSQCWLLCSGEFGDGELLEWEPILWVPLPHQFRERRDESWAIRRIRHGYGR